MKKTIIFVYFISLGILSSLFMCDTFAQTTSGAMDENTAEMFAQNNILFYEPCKNNSYSGSLCGNTATEKVWSGLRQFLSPEQAAGAMGNMANEGNFNPVCHETRFRNSGIDIYANSGPSYGIGLIQWSFGRRVGLLQYILDKNQNLKKYFDDWQTFSTCGGYYDTSKFATSGDAFIDIAHNDSDVNQLYQYEIEYLKQEIETNPTYNGLLQTSTVEEATTFFLNNIEGNPGDKLGDRIRAAQKYYDELKDFTCGSSSATPKNNNTSTSSNTTTSNASASPCMGEFKEYLQCGQSWSNDPFGSCTSENSICQSGCGPTSFAMLATMLLNRDISPSETAKIAGDAGMHVCGAGSSHNITKVLAENYSLDYKDIRSEASNDKVGVISKYLKDGWLIHASGQGAPPWTGGGHYIGIRGITSDEKWLTADSAGSYGHDNQKEWDPSEIASGMNGAIYAIKSNTQACNGTTCSSDNSAGLKSGGMNIEEAKNFMKPYQEEASKKARGQQNFQDAIISDAGCKDGTLNNCVAFSQWFINKYTSVGPNGSPTADGGEMVNKLLGANLGFEDGGNTPKAYAIFSNSYHTGVVLGIDKENDKIIIGEANCDGYGTINGWMWPDAHEDSLSKYTGGNYKFAYTDKILKMGGT